ncbi:hypothetical protein C8R43DRAFT_1119774 [Mycena crocata]|nr:hypothetical protein C8R43DRAFT_1119774 [Mycena crocata]
MDSGPPPPPTRRPLGSKNRNYTTALPVPVIPPPPTNASEYSLAPSSSTTATPTDLPIPTVEQPAFPHTQERLRQPKKTAAEKRAEKFTAMEAYLKASPFESLGEFLHILFHNPQRDVPDPRRPTHVHSVARFLRGRTDIKMSDILPLMYYHRASFPTTQCAESPEREKMFSTAGTVDDIHHARPYISTWATRLVGVEARKQVGRATRDDPDDPDGRSQLRASSNGRREARVVSWRELLSHFNLKWIETKYCIKLPLPMFLTESMSAPSANGVLFVRKRRPHPIIQVGAIASFILSRNRYANGDLAMALGVWHFACKSHTDVKRIYSRFGHCVSDNTARNALVSMTAASMAELRDNVKQATERGEVKYCRLVDNIQQQCDVYEQGVGRVSELKVGTAAIEVELQDCAPGAFDAQIYYDQVVRQQRQTLTTDALFDDINWDRLRKTMNLHWVRPMIEFIVELAPLSTQIAVMFRTEPIAVLRMQEDRPKHNCQPLATNGERETSHQGMKRANEDFDGQVGIDSENPGNLLSWIRGDGSSYAAILKLTNYCTALGSFKNKISTPEIWHTGATDLNSIAANHYGPSTSSDPSSLSKCSNIAGLKRPSNIKSVDYYPSVRNFTLIWKAHVLDCWRLYFEVDDLETHFRDLAAAKQLPSLDELLEIAETLVDRYATQSSIRISLSAAESTDPERLNKVPIGSPWAAPTNAHDPEDAMPDLVDIVEPDATPDRPPAPKKPAEGPKFHEEKSGFTGDRVLRNVEIFLLEFGWWIEFAHAVPEGDIGRVWEIMKIWIFKFAGSSHHNYKAYLLEVYCLLRYEASKDLKNAILNNWLLKVKDELGKYIPGDLHQEHFNKWLEDMIQKHGGEFDDDFYRKTIAPNVHHFLQIKEEVETAFSLEHRGKTHTSPHQRAELRLLLTAFKEEEVHLFRSGRSMGHAAVNQFARGFRRLDTDDQLGDWLKKTSFLGKLHGEMRRTDMEHPSTNDEDFEMCSNSPGSTPRSDSPGSAQPSERSDSSGSTPHSRSPSPSVSGSETSSGEGSVRSRSSVESAASLRSQLAEGPDPNEPEDDGVDRTDVRLSSGSTRVLVVNQETGAVEMEEEVDVEIEENSDDEGEVQEDEEDEEAEDESDEHEEE